MTRTTMAKVATLLLLGATSALAQPRVDFRDPVFGGVMQVIVDHAYPNAAIHLAAFVADAAGRPDPANPIGEPMPIGYTDASGSLRHGFDLTDPSWRERDVAISLIVSDDPADPNRWSEPVALRIEAAPSLLITAVDAGGNAFLYQWQLGADLPSARHPLGRGNPGGAVRDGRHQKIYAVADAARGEVRILRDALLGDDAGLQRSLLLGTDLRGIAVTPDGRQVLFTAARNGDSRLYLVDTRTDEVREMAIDPLGPDGGRIVVSEDGMTAFVVIRNLYIRQIHLLHQSLGYLLAVGDPGQTEIRDLRMAQGNLFALTGRGRDDGTGSVTGVATADLRNVAQYGRLRTGPRIGTASKGTPDGPLPALFVLDGAAGTVSVIDARTMQRRGELAVPPGAEALLLTPDPAHTRGLLLYGEPATPSQARRIDFAPAGGLEVEIGEPRDLGFPAEAVAMLGTSARVHEFAVRDDLGRVWMFDDQLVATPVPLSAVTVVALSVQ